MQNRDDDSPRSKTMIERGREITKLVSQAVVADRQSRNFSVTNAHSIRAAKSRDEAVALLKEKVLAFGEDL